MVRFLRRWTQICSLLEHTPHKGVLSRPLAACARLVDDDDGLGVWRVVPGEVAALKDSHTHGLEISGGGEVDKRSGIRILGVIAADGFETPLAIAIKRQHVGDTDGLDPGKRADAIDFRLEKIGALDE